MADLTGGWLYLTDMIPDAAADIATFTLNSSNDKLGWQFQAQAAVPLTRLFTSQVLTGASPVFRVGLQRIDASGDPAGVFISGTDSTDTVATGGKLWTMPSSYQPAKGEVLALVAEHSSGTIDGSNNAAFRYGSGTYLWNRPTAYTKTDGAAWVKGQGKRAVNFGYGSSTRWYGWPSVTTGDTQITTVGHRVAVKWTLPTGWFHSIRVRSMSWRNRPAASDNGTFLMGIWDAAGSTLIDTSFPTMMLHPWGFSGPDYNTILHFDEVSPLLYAGQTYYFGFQHVSSTYTRITTYTLASSDYLSAWAGASNGYVATWNGSAWTQLDAISRGFGIDCSEYNVASGIGRGTSRGM